MKYADIKVNYLYKDILITTADSWIIWECISEDSKKLSESKELKFIMSSSNKKYGLGLATPNQDYNAIFEIGRSIDHPEYFLWSQID